MAARRWWIGSGGDDKLVDAQVSGCQGGLFGCHPSRFLPGTVHYSPCEMPLYIAWWCEQGELNNTGRNQPGALLLQPQSRGQVAQRGATRGQEREGGEPWESPARHRFLSSLCGSRARSSVFLLGIPGLATSLASLRVSLPTEPLIKRGFV